MFRPKLLLYFWNLLLFILVSSAAAFAANGGMALEGVSISGAEDTPQDLPGVNGYDYVFPTKYEMDYFSSKGMNCIRVALMWERLQPQANGPLDPYYTGLMDDTIAYASSKGLSTVVDIHNHGAYYNQTVGVAGGVPNSVFADLWARLAARYKTIRK